MFAKQGFAQVATSGIAKGGQPFAGARGFLSERAKEGASKPLARSEQGASPRQSLLFPGRAGGEERLLRSPVLQR